MVLEIEFGARLEKIMKLSISNIAWPQNEEEFFLKQIKQWGCSGVELAPSRFWPNPHYINQEEINGYKALLSRIGLEVCAMQALLYGRPELGVFRSPNVEQETIEFIKSLCDLAVSLSAPVLVFGSPANRQRGQLSMDEAFERAASFFQPVALHASKLGVCVCIEPLRPQETDFITSAEEGLRLVRMINSPGFGLHLDAKAVSAEPTDTTSVIHSCAGEFRHFHVNDPELVEINSTNQVNHNELGNALRGIGYKKYVSIEMRKMPDYYTSIQRSISFSCSTYLYSGRNTND